ncbi:MAG TPA: glycosyltransferase [Streptosporangiaceae bacterium]|nr:glycosyltransferase [Streptosporangiaceae bacterium]
MTATPPLDVYGWMADRSGCGHIRIVLPLTVLRTHGLRTGWSQRLDRDRLPAQTLIGQRLCLPGPTGLWKELARRSNRPRLVFEIDDDLWDIDHRSEQAHEFFGGKDVRANLNANVRCADAVTVTTERLADRIRPLNPNVHVIPNYLPAWLLEHERPRRDDGIVTIGWGGSNTHDMDFAELKGPLRQFLARNPNAEFHVIGADYATWMGLPADRCRITPWVASVPDFWRALDFDIALAPLRPHLFNQSKSAVKALEAAMLGIPIIASDVGPYSDFVRHGETGYLVKRDHEWGKYLRVLVNDPAARAEMGAAARRQAAGHTIEGNTDAWKKALA